MNESKFYKKFKKIWMQYKNSYCSRVETKFEDGRPDLHLVNQNGIDFFVELKFIKKRFINKKLPLRTSQIIWFFKYNGGVRSFVLIQIGDEFFTIEQKKIKEDPKKFHQKIKFSDFQNISEKKINLENLINEIQLIKK